MMPHTIVVGGGLPISLLCQENRWRERNNLTQTYLNNLKTWPDLKEEESRPRREADRRGSL
jgi:hypothetical protein